jgi:hypothetical protein
MKQELAVKVLKLAAQIAWMHGAIAGNRACQDWSGETDVLDSLTQEERDELFLQYEQYNSGGEEFELGYFPYDEMLISFIIARALEVMGDKVSEYTIIEKEDSVTVERDGKQYEVFFDDEDYCVFVGNPQAGSLVELRLPDPLAGALRIEYWPKW